MSSAALAAIAGERLAVCFILPPLWPRLLIAHCSQQPLPLPHPYHSSRQDVIFEVRQCALAPQFVGEYQYIASAAESVEHWRHEDPATGQSIAVYWQDQDHKWQLADLTLHSNNPKFENLVRCSAGAARPAPCPCPLPPAPCPPPRRRCRLLAP